MPADPEVGVVELNDLYVAARATTDPPYSWALITIGVAGAFFVG
jgi:hypothetical protein